MSGIRSKSDLPKWYMLDNYDELKSLSEPELLNQLKLRLEIISKLQDSIKDNAPDWVINNLYEDIVWQQITKGNPVVKSDAESGINDGSSSFEWLSKFGLSADDLNALSIESSPAIKGFPASLAVSIGRHIDRLDLIKPLENDNPLAGILELYPMGYSDSDINMLKKGIPPLSNNDDIHVGINITDFSNEEILYQLEKLLPLWRKTLKKPNPKGKGLSKSIICKKIIKYQVVAFVDLFIWQHFEQRKIPHKVFVVALFPNGEKGEYEFKQTILPFVMKVMNLVSR